MPSIVTEERRTSGVITPPPVWPPDSGRGGPDGFGGSGNSGSMFPVTKEQIGLWVLLIGIVMLFAGLSSAFIVLRGIPSWQNIAIPSLLWVNTVVLVASSGTIELSRRSLQSNNIERMKRWLVISGILGAGFLLGQLAAWRQLVNAGVYLPSTLHSSFFYILTGLHGIHLLGAIGGLGYVLVQAFRHRITPVKQQPLRLCATYWHAMDMLWVYLAILLVLA